MKKKALEKWNKPIEPEIYVTLVSISENKSNCSLFYSIYVITIHLIRFILSTFVRQSMIRFNENVSSFELFLNSIQMPKPSISMPNAVSNRPGFDDDNASANASPQHQTQAHQQQSGQKGAGSSKAVNDNGKKAAPGKDAKAGANAQRWDFELRDGVSGFENIIFNYLSNSSGWFSWFKLKPKNQMILPDDKNPTVSHKFIALFEI